MMHILEYGYLVCRVFIGFLLLFTGIVKAASLKEFGNILGGHDILPGMIVQQVAAAIVLLELVTAVGLLLNLVSPAPQWAACFLFLTFGLFVATSLLRGKSHLPCGCLGSRSGRISWQLVVRNFALAGISLIAAHQVLLAVYISAPPLILLWLGKLTTANKEPVTEITNGR